MYKTQNSLIISNGMAAVDTFMSACWLYFW